MGKEGSSSDSSDSDSSSDDDSHDTDKQKLVIEVKSEPKEEDAICSRTSAASSSSVATKRKQVSTEERTKKYFKIQPMARTPAVTSTSPGTASMTAVASSASENPASVV